MSYAGLLNQTATFEAHTSKDKNGVASYGSAVSARVRFQPVHKSVMSATNERIPVDGIVFCAPDLAVNILDRVTYAGQKFKVIKKEPVPGGNGLTHHIELMVQLWRTT